METHLDISNPFKKFCLSTPLSSYLVSWRFWVVATHFGPEWSAARVLEWHQLRGEFENFFKGLKNDVGVGHLPTGDFHANAVFFRMGVLAYNLFIGFKQDLLPASCQRWTLRTVRWRFFSLAGRIVRHARALVLKLAVDAVSLNLLLRIHGQCQGALWVGLKAKTTRIQHRPSWPKEPERCNKTGQRGRPLLSL